MTIGVFTCSVLAFSLSDIISHSTASSHYVIPYGIFRCFIISGNRRLTVHHQIPQGRSRFRDLFTASTSGVASFQKPLEHRETLLTVFSGLPGTRQWKLFTMEIPQGNLHET